MGSMSKILERITTSILRRLGYMRKNNGLPRDFEQSFLLIQAQTASYTMTSPERMYALYQATQYISLNNLAGDIVECGVWRGGSAMVAALTLKSLEDTDRELYLYDTYKGMSKPGREDQPSELKKWSENQNTEFNNWAYASLAEVKHNLFSTQYPKDKILFIVGDVLETIPERIPEKISLLRLDTDWYESTYHELVNLYPRLQKGGVLIIDDYGSKQGARRAVDQYFQEKGLNPYLARIDATCRVLIKP